MTFMTSPRVGMMIQSDEHIFHQPDREHDVLAIFFGVPQTNPTNSRSETNIDLKPSHCKSYKKVLFYIIVFVRLLLFLVATWITWRVTRPLGLKKKDLFVSRDTAVVPKEMSGDLWQSALLLQGLHGGCEWGSCGEFRGMTGT